jgi:tetratricopeptide (TPR) repeat protein
VDAPPPPPLPPSPRRARAEAAAAAALVLAAVLVAYRGVGAFGFVDFDDSRYVFQNPVVLAGLTREGVAWAFTALHASNWHPLTWLSHMLDVTLFGPGPAAMHRVSVAWHAANALLLLAVLRAASGALWRSALAAAVFAAHPLAVESVAWIAERKNVLSTFFFLLAIGAYLRHVRRPGPGRYLLVAAAFALGLLAKPMVVTLPVVLLALDVWPLGRLAPGVAPLRALAPLVREKLPLLALSAASSAVTLVAQARGGTISTAEALPIPERLANAAVACAWYLVKAVWPSDLAVFYPHPAWSPSGISAWRVAGGAALLAALTLGALGVRRARPWVPAGWAWFLVTLLPVIGLVQVGLQGTADRYAYLPLVGPFAAAALSLPARPRPWARVALAAPAAAAVAWLAIAAHAQAATWRDSFTLFSHAAEAVPGNWLAWKNVGMYRFQRGEYREAVRAFEESLRSEPTDPDTWSNLGVSLAALDDHAAAAGALERSAALRPGDADVLSNLAVARALSGRLDLALRAVERLAAVDPARARQLLARLRGEGAPPAAAQGGTP